MEEVGEEKEREEVALEEVVSKEKEEKEEVEAVEETVCEEKEEKMVEEEAQVVEEPRSRDIFQEVENEEVEEGWNEEVEEGWTEEDWEIWREVLRAGGKNKGRKRRLEMFQKHKYLKAQGLWVGRRCHPEGREARIEARPKRRP